MNSKRKQAIEDWLEYFRRRNPILEPMKFILEERDDSVLVRYEAASQKYILNAKLIGTRCAREGVKAQNMDGFIAWVLEQSVNSITKKEDYVLDLDASHTHHALKKARIDATSPR